MYVGKTYLDDKFEDLAERELDFKRIGVKVGPGNLHYLQVDGDKLELVELGDVKNLDNLEFDEELQGGRVFGDEGEIKRENEAKAKEVVKAAVKAYEALPYDPLFEAPRAPFVDFKDRVFMKELQQVSYGNYGLWKRPQMGEQLFGFEVADYYHFAQVKQEDLFGDVSFCGQRAVRFKTQVITDSSKSKAMIASYIYHKPERKAWSVVQARAPSSVYRAPILSKDFICYDHHKPVLKYTRTRKPDKKANPKEYEEVVTNKNKAYGIENTDYTVDTTYYLQKRGNMADTRSESMKNESWRQRRTWTVGIEEGAYGFEKFRDPVTGKVTKKSGVFVGITAATVFGEEGLSVGFDLNGNMRYGSCPTQMTTFVPSHPFVPPAGPSKEDGDKKMADEDEMSDDERVDQAPVQKEPQEKDSSCEMLDQLRRLQSGERPFTEFKDQFEQSRKGCRGNLIPWETSKHYEPMFGYNEDKSWEKSVPIVRVTLDLHITKTKRGTNFDGSDKMVEEYDPLLIVEINPPEGEEVVEWEEGDEMVKNPSHYEKVSDDGSSARYVVRLSTVRLKPSKASIENRKFESSFHGSSYDAIIPRHWRLLVVTQEDGQKVSMLPGIRIKYGGLEGAGANKFWNDFQSYVVGEPGEKNLVPNDALRTAPEPRYKYVKNFSNIENPVRVLGNDWIEVLNIPNVRGGSRGFVRANKIVRGGENGMNEEDYDRLRALLDSGRRYIPDAELKAIVLTPYRFSTVHWMEGSNHVCYRPVIPPKITYQAEAVDGAELFAQEQLQKEERLEQAMKDFDRGLTVGGKSEHAFIEYVDELLEDKSRDSSKIQDALDKLEMLMNEQRKLAEERKDEIKKMSGKKRQADDWLEAMSNSVLPSSWFNAGTRKRSLKAKDTLRKTAPKLEQLKRLQQDESERIDSYKKRRVGLDTLRKALAIAQSRERSKGREKAGSSSAPPPVQEQSLEDAEMEAEEVEREAARQAEREAALEDEREAERETAKEQEEQQQQMEQEPYSPSDSSEDEMEEYRDSSIWRGLRARANPYTTHEVRQTDLFSRHLGYRSDCFVDGLRQIRVHVGDSGAGDEVVRDIRGTILNWMAEKIEPGDFERPLSIPVPFEVAEKKARATMYIKLIYFLYGDTNTLEAYKMYRTRETQFFRSIEKDAMMRLASKLTNHEAPSGFELDIMKRMMKRRLEHLMYGYRAKDYEAGWFEDVEMFASAWTFRRSVCVWFVQENRAKKVYEPNVNTEYATVIADLSEYCGDTTYYFKQVQWMNRGGLQLLAVLPGGNDPAKVSATNMEPVPVKERTRYNESNWGEWDTTIDEQTDAEWLSANSFEIVRFNAGYKPTFS